MLDIHCHILPYIDDGATDMEESIEMAYIAAQSGVTSIIATPHYYAGTFSKEYKKDILQLIEELQMELDVIGIPIQLHAGMEVFGTEDVAEEIRRKTVLPLHKSNLLLVEFDPEDSIERMNRMIRSIKQEGMTPVIAHPERYDCIQKQPSLVEVWKKEDYKLQVNKGSLFGRFGRRAQNASNALLQQDWIDFIASDAHGCEMRTPDMSEIRAYLRQEKGEEYTKRLLQSKSKLCCY